MKLELTLDELLEVELALENYMPIDDEDILAAHRARYSVAKLLKRPWAEKFVNAEEAATHHLAEVKAG